MPIIWPTIDLNSKTTQQGLLSFAALLLSSTGGVLTLMAPTHSGTTVYAAGAFFLTTIAGGLKAYIGNNQKDAGAPDVADTFPTVSETKK